MYKGGRLLCLSFVAPLLIEQENRKLLNLAEQGIFSIGMALQVIDDLTDFYEDMRDSRHNYLVSVIHCEGTEKERMMLAGALATRSGSGPAIEEVYPDSVGLVMERAIGEACCVSSCWPRPATVWSRRALSCSSASCFACAACRGCCPFSRRKRIFTRP